MIITNSSYNLIVLSKIVLIISMSFIQFKKIINIIFIKLYLNKENLGIKCHLAILNKL